MDRGRNEPGRCNHSQLLRSCQWTPCAPNSSLALVKDSGVSCATVLALTDSIISAWCCIGFRGTTPAQLLAHRNQAGSVEV